MQQQRKGFMRTRFLTSNKYCNVALCPNFQNSLGLCEKWLLLVLHLFHSVYFVLHQFQFGMQITGIYCNSTKSFLISSPWTRSVPPLVVCCRTFQDIQYLSLKILLHSTTLSLGQSIYNLTCRAAHSLANNLQTLESSLLAVICQARPSYNKALYMLLPMPVPLLPVRQVATGAVIAFSSVSHPDG